METNEEESKVNKYIISKFLYKSCMFTSPILMSQIT